MKRIFLLSVFFLVTACSGQSDISDLQEFVAATTSKPKGRIQPLPEFKPYSAFVYSASALRSPFESPVAYEEMNHKASMVEPPDFTRPRQALERYKLTDLTLVGTLSKELDGDIKALIKTNAGNVHVVELNSYIGKNHGRIVEIRDSKIELIEVVPNGSGGWISRPETLGLNQPAKGE